MNFRETPGKIGRVGMSGLTSKRASSSMNGSLTS